MGLADRYPRYGFGKLFAVLRRHGFRWNHKRVFRVYCLLKINLRREGKKLLPSRNNEMPNIEVVNTICALLDELRPDPAGPYSRLITYVKDQPGHDRRYAIDARKIERELGWRPAETFETGIRKTVQWYLDNQDWVSNVASGSCREWLGLHYGDSGNG